MQDGNFSQKIQSIIIVILIVLSILAVLPLVPASPGAEVTCEQHIYNSDGDAVDAYNWGNWTASAGDTRVGNYSDAGQTFIKATNTGDAAGDAIISWSAGTLDNDSHTIDIDGNIKYVYGTDDASPSGVASWTYSAVDADHSFTVSVPATSTLWIYFEIQDAGVTPAGKYTQSFTWTVV